MREYQRIRAAVIRGGDPLTSKVAIIARSARPDADVDYTVGHVSGQRGEEAFRGI
jgi:2-methylaconitate cis-trans-isomerase PrpF